jgi:hypothetical protein
VGHRTQFVQFIKYLTRSQCIHQYTTSGSLTLQIQHLRGYIVVTFVFVIVVVLRLPVYFGIRDTGHGPESHVPARLKINRQQRSCRKSQRLHSPFTAKHQFFSTNSGIVSPHSEYGVYTGSYGMEDRKNSSPSWKIPERMASPLLHPFGLPLLKTYQSLLEENDGQNSGEGFEEDKKNQTVSCDLASKLTDGIVRKIDDDDDDNAKESIWMASECSITAKIRKVLQQNSTDSVTYTREHPEHVEGRNSQGVLLKGNPDIVQRFPVVDEKNSSITCGESTTTENEIENEVVLCIQKMDKGIAMMITEASVDNNGGEQKLAQAYEYARLQKGGPSNQVLILIWLHFNRKFKSGNGKLSERFVRLSITQESWLFCWRPKKCRERPF